MGAAQRTSESSTEARGRLASSLARQVRIAVECAEDGVPLSDSHLADEPLTHEWVSRPLLSICPHPPRSRGYG